LARDRQSNHDRLRHKLTQALSPHLSSPGPPAVSTNPVYSATHSRHAIRRPSRFALQLEAQPAGLKFLQTSLATFNYFELVSLRPRPKELGNAREQFGCLWQTFQETSDTQWQKN
jgi:hypothetical protein